MPPRYYNTGMRNAYIIRGLPGSGKTTLALKLAENVVSADDFMVDSKDRYHFAADKLPEVHRACFETWQIWLRQGRLSVAVHNTFSCKWEFGRYVEAVKAANRANVFADPYVITIIDLFDNGMDDFELFKRNVHEVPLRTIREMRARWEK